MTLADRLRKAMAHAGMSQKQLADAVGIKPPSVSGWLSGKSKFLRGENLLKASDAMGVSADWLASGLGPMTTTESETMRRSQPQRIDPAILAASIKLIRMSFEALGVEFDQESDGVPTVLAYEYLLKRDQRTVTADNVVDFCKILKSKPQGESDDTGAGVAGSGNRIASAGGARR